MYDGKNFQILDDALK